MERRRPHLQRQSWSVCGQRGIDTNVWRCTNSEDTSDNGARAHSAWLSAHCLLLVYASMPSLGVPSAVVAAAACVAVLMSHLHDSDVQSYVSAAAATQMHKVVLSAKDDAELGEAADILSKAQIKHHVWIENPEKIRTCLAVKPYPRHIVQPLLRHLKLFR